MNGNKKEDGDNDGAGSDKAVVETTVCCGCRPSRRKYQKEPGGRHYMRTLSSHFFRRAQYVDAEQGNDSVWVNDIDSQFFFDAEEEPLGEDEYPPFFTTALQHPKPVVSMDHPETLLKSQLIEPQEPDSKLVAVPAKTCKRLESFPIANHRVPSFRFQKMIRRPTLERKTELETPRVKLTEQGYPGELTFAELAECQKFLKGLKLLDPAVLEQIYSFRDIEEEPYTICRWLRATKFDADAILKRCEENQEMFEAAKQQDFSPNVGETIGAPFSVFLSQYPFLPIGRAKNGCPVNYFQAGRINPEGIMSMTSIDRIQGYFWWSFMWKMKEEIRKAQERDPDFVRVEGINILDLEGLSASAISSETMEVIKLASKVSDFFPETLHCMIILNAPKFFSFSWGLIKKFIDPRTASRIQVFSSDSKGTLALQKLIDTDQIPLDYGGTNKSIKEAFMEESADPTLRRQEIELVHVKKNSNKSTKKAWELEKGEYMTITAYTRSASAGALTVKLNRAEYKTVPVKCVFEARQQQGGEEEPMPKCTVVVSKLLGPGKVTIEIKDLDDAPKKHQGQSRGYFLVVGDIKADDS